MTTKLLHLATTLTFAIALASLMHPLEQALTGLPSRASALVPAPFASVFAVANGLLQTLGAQRDDTNSRIPFR